MIQAIAIVLIIGFNWFPIIKVSHTTSMKLGTIFSRCGKRYYIQELAWTELLSFVRFVNLEPGDMQSYTTDTTRLVNQAPQRALPPSPKKNERCFNAFLIVFGYTVGIGCLILGGTYINDCPDQKMLPIGLIIFGGILVVSRLLNCVYDCRSMFDEDDLEDTPPCVQALSVIFFFASLGIFVAVCLWTISLDPTTKPEDRGLKNYCDSTLAYAAAWVCIAGIVFFVMPVFSGCCGGIFSDCCSS